MYDASIARWNGVDKLAEEYGSFTPYSYVANNPLLFIDPDGNRILIGTSHNEGQKKVSTTKEQQNAILENLQGLTDDVLGFDETNNQVFIISKGEGAKNRGTQLIRDLIGDPDSDDYDPQKGVQIVYSVDGNRTESFLNGGQDKLKDDGTPGDGSPAKIEFDPNLEEGGLNENGNYKRPTKIGLGHELLHAERINNGTSTTNQPKVDAYDPDYNKNDELDKEEIEIRKEENVLRDENGVSRRVIPTILKK